MFNFNYLTISNKKHALVASAVIGIFYLSYNLGKKYCPIFNKKEQTSSELDNIPVNDLKVETEKVNESNEEEVVEKKNSETDIKIEF